VLVERTVRRERGWPDAIPGIFRTAPLAAQRTGCGGASGPGSTTRRRLLGLAVVLVLLGCLLAAGYEVLVYTAQPDAVHISRSLYSGGRILAERTITDPRIVADDYQTLNRLPSAENLVFHGCAPATAYSRIEDYRVTFTYHGIDIEDAFIIAWSCATWRIDRYPLEAVYWDPTGLMTPILATVQS